MAKKVLTKRFVKIYYKHWVECVSLIDREVILKKKLLPFGHCPKVALTPPLVSDTCGVTFV